VTTSTLTFPSADWFQALADITKEDQGYKKFGRLNAVIAFKCGDTNVSCNFDVLDIHDIEEVSDEALRDVDIVIEMPPEIWKDMLENIKAEGHATGEWTLNTLDLRLDEEIHKNLMEDGFKADMFFRYNPSLQVFMDNAAKLDFQIAS
jgi:predicted small metal-binding protein